MMDSSDAEREAAQQNMAPALDWVLEAENAGDFASAQARLNRIRQWAETIPERGQRNAFLYWVDVRDSIIEDDRAAGRLRTRMPVPDQLSLRCQPKRVGP